MLCIPYKMEEGLKECLMSSTFLRKTLFWLKTISANLCISRRKLKIMTIYPTGAEKKKCKYQNRGISRHIGWSLI